MTFVQTLLSPIEPAVACLACAVVDLLGLLAWIRCSHRLRLACRAAAGTRPPHCRQGVGARGSLTPHSPASLHPSPTSPIASVGLATLGRIIGWAVVSTSWISDGVAALLLQLLGLPRTAATPHAPDFALSAARTILLFLGYELGFFFDPCTQAPHFGAMGAAQGAPLRRSALTPLVNFRVHPLDSLILYTSTISRYSSASLAAPSRARLGETRRHSPSSIQNVLMLLYICT